MLGFTRKKRHGRIKDKLSRLVAGVDSWNWKQALEQNKNGRTFIQ